MYKTFRLNGFTKNVVIGDQKLIWDFVVAEK